MLVKKNDIDKLVCPTLDGLTGVAFKDDCQVINLIAERRCKLWRTMGADIEIQLANNKNKDRPAVP